MSRVGKNPIAIPDSVKVALNSGVLSITGKAGAKEVKIHDSLKLDIVDGAVKVGLKSDSRESRMIWGTTQRNISNIVAGNVEPFQIRLTLNGVGYRAQMQGAKLKLSLGFSHDIEYAIPAGIAIKCEKPTLVVISGADKEVVGQVAAEIRGFRKTEPYKAKGVYPEGMQVYRKEGKKK